MSCIKSHLVKNLSGPCGHCDTKESHKWYDAPHLHLTLGVEHGKVDAFTLKNAILIYTDLHVLHCELRFLLQISLDSHELVPLERKVTRGAPGPGGRHGVLTR